MDILVIGSGAREHAIIARLRSDRTAHDIVAAPGNAGIAAECTTTPVDITDPAAVAALAVRLQPQLVIIGPEAPLIAGVADAVRAAGFPVFGPDRAAAALEGSKAFAKEIMAQAGVPTARAINAHTLADVEAAMAQIGAPYVVKADGLAAGKGVLVTDDRAAAIAHAEKWIDQGVLVEQFLAGEEVSLFFLSDGTRVAPLSPAQDYKRLLDEDRGPNTGGMGAYSPIPWLPAGFVAEVESTVAQPVIDALREHGTPFVGLLYCGLIVSADGILVIEFNARFGDPETQVVLPRLQGEFGDLLLQAAIGDLHDVPEFSNDDAVTVVLASEGYPQHTVTGRRITGVADAAEVDGVHVIHAATELIDGELFATGGRVLNVQATAKTFPLARQAAYAGINRIHLQGGQFRTDIAAKVSK